MIVFDDFFGGQIWPRKVIKHNHRFIKDVKGILLVTLQIFGSRHAELLLCGGPVAGGVAQWNQNFNVWRFFEISSCQMTVTKRISCGPVGVSCDILIVRPTLSIVRQAADLLWRDKIPRRKLIAGVGLIDRSWEEQIENIISMLYFQTEMHRQA